jgi:hypothetical protein
LDGTRCSDRTFGAGTSLLVHLAPNEVASGSVITSVQLGKPLAIFVLGDAAAHFVGVRPHHGRIVSNISSEPITKNRMLHIRIQRPLMLHQEVLEWFDSFLAEELDLVVPIDYGPFPVGVGALPALLVNEQILSDLKSSCN